MDVCLVLYHSDASRVEPGVREQDTLFIFDNTYVGSGFAAGANAAAALGSDPLICFVNPDGDLTQDCLDKLEQAMNDPTVVACEPMTGRDVDMLPNGDLEWVAGTCVVIRRDAFERVGGFDKQLFMYHEDIDLSYKLAPFGRFVLVSDAIYPHDWGHPLSFRSRFLLCRNMLVVDKRHGSGANFKKPLRDAASALKEFRWKDCAALIGGMSDYLLRARTWA
jgi:GT2 family glycosyltransferase